MKFDSASFKKTLEQYGIVIKKFDPEKSRAVYLKRGQSITAEKLSQVLREKIPLEVFAEQKELANLVQNPDKLHDTLDKFTTEWGVHVDCDAHNGPEENDYYRSLTLNIDESSDMEFILTDENDRVSHVNGKVYLRVMRLREEDAAGFARRVVPEYRPRSANGVFDEKTPGGAPVKVLNTYVPPNWQEYKGTTPKALPEDFKKLILHLFPIKEEREYFFNWLYSSLFTRSYIYLVLCGAPAAGKNTLKLFMSALHGHNNSVDGKKSNLTERFNAQFQGATLVWFDELHYDMEMENVMKEMQNDTISIEKKNYDATRRTRIYSSFVISNNKPRDNYIAFDARKFAPLQISSKRLDSIMTNKEIAQMIAKIADPTKPEYDIAYVAQIGRWIRRQGWSGKWPMLEYKGPMFFKLAHTSMSRWQKRAATLVFETEPREGSRVVFDTKKGFQWSTLENAVQKKGDRSMQFPDYSTVQHFFDVFVDDKGRKAFKTTAVPNNIMGDFFVMCVNDTARIVTDAEVTQQMGTDNVKNLDDYL